MNLPIFFTLVLFQFAHFNGTYEESLEKKYFSWNNPENHSFDYFIQSRKNNTDIDDPLIPLNSSVLKLNRSPAIDFSEDF